MEEAKAVRRLTAFGNLGDQHLALLAGRRTLPVHHRAKSTLQRQGAPQPQLLLVHRGWCMSSMTMLNGSRLITKLHLPGDLIGAPNLPVGVAVETVTALTDATTGSLSVDELGEIFARSPRIAAMLFLIAQEERLVLMDRIAMIGRLSGEARIAAFLLHIYDRLKAVGLEKDDSIFIPLTQDAIADLLGLTPVHVNRLLKNLRSRGLISYQSKKYHLHDIDQLQQLATLPRRKIAGPMNWLPS